VGPVEEWPADRLQSAYSFLSRRVSATLSLPQGDPGRDRLPEHRQMCEQVGAELVRRGLL
ncbi:MAG: hypothetical protein U0Y82_06205, partial [Thermoleophilia bacterium]